MGCATCDFACADCRACTYEVGEDFILTDEVWAPVAGKDEVLCLGCLEARLGRELQLADFAEAETNMDPYQSERLRDRLSRHPAGLWDGRCPDCREHVGHSCRPVAVSPGETSTREAA